MNRFCQVATFVLGMSGMLIAQTPDELIVRLQQKYEALESFSADFEQMFLGGGRSTAGIRDRKNEKTGENVLGIPAAHAKILYR